MEIVSFFIAPTLIFPIARISPTYFFANLQGGVHAVIPKAVFDATPEEDDDFLLNDGSVSIKFFMSLAYAVAGAALFALV